MFWRIEIGEFGGLFTRFRLNQEDAVRQNFLDAFHAGKFGGLFGDLRLDFRDKFLVCRNQDGLFTARAMLRLRQNVRRDIGGTGRLVRQNHDFRRAGDEIKSDFAVELTLRRRHIGVARTDDFLNFANGLRTIPQGGDGIDAAELVDFRRARDFACVQNGRIDVAVFRRWRNHNDFLHAGRFCDGDRVHNRRKQRGGAARNVATDAIQRGELLAERDAFARRERPRFWNALPRKGGDMIHGRLDGLDRLVVNGGNAVQTDAEGFGRQIDMVEPFGVFDERGVAVGFDVCKNLRDAFVDLRIEGGAFDQRFKLFLEIG